MMFLLQRRARSSNTQIVYQHELVHDNGMLLLISGTAAYPHPPRPHETWAHSASWVLILCLFQFWFVWFSSNNVSLHSTGREID